MLFAEATRSACGQASAAVGPFYCPADHDLYLDTAFFERAAQPLRRARRLRAGLRDRARGRPSRAEPARHDAPVRRAIAARWTSAAQRAVGAPRAAGRLLCGRVGLLSRRSATSSTPGDIEEGTARRRGRGRRPDQQGPAAGRTRSRMAPPAARALVQAPDCNRAIRAIAIRSTRAERSAATAMRSAIVTLRTTRRRVALLTCPGCGAPMRRSSLRAAPLAPLTLDLCDDCQALWLDTTESLQLTPGALIDLFRAISASRPRQRAAVSRRCPARAADTALADAGRPAHDAFHVLPLPLRARPAHAACAVPAREELHPRRSRRAKSTRLRATVSTVRCASCGGPVELDRSAVCPYCGAPVMLLDPDAVGKALAELDSRERRGAPQQSR